jgi:nucleotide-binding universal stress UspA family protein
MKSILVPIDCSAASTRIVDLARQIAKAFAAEIHLIHVREISPATPAAPMGYGVSGMPELMPMPMIDPGAQALPEKSHKAELAKWQKEIEEAGVKATLHEPTGTVVDEILKQADAVNADFIVMGSHGHGAMYNLLVGSVTEGVLKRSTRPVLLVPSAAKLTK